MNHKYGKVFGPVRVTIIAAMVIAWSAQQGNVQERRQLGAHQHGHGTLNLAIEGSTLKAELEVPGADIVGFEHKATTSADKKKIAAARKKLANASALLTLPAKAGCRLTSAGVEVKGEEAVAPHAEKHAGHGREKHGAHGGKKHDHHGEAKHGNHAGEKHGEHAHEAAHSEFHVAYAFECASIAALAQISFPYFRTFPGAEELDVTLITQKGQKSFEVNRQTTRIDIQDLL